MARQRCIFAACSWQGGRTLHRLRKRAEAACVAVQVHTVGELERVLSIGELEGCMLGINNRDLGTFKVDLHNTKTIMESAAGQQVRGAPWCPNCVVPAGCPSGRLGGGEL